MPMYIIRVMFNYADGEKPLYDELDKRMEEGGFRKNAGTIFGKEFRLPEGQYMRRENKLSIDGLRLQVEQIAYSLKSMRRPAIFVSDTRSVSYSGLEPVKPPPKTKAFHTFMEKLGIGSDK